MLFHPGKPAEPGHARLWLAMFCVLVALVSELFALGRFRLWPPSERPFPINLLELAVSVFAIWLIGTTARKRMRKPSQTSSYIVPCIIGLLALATTALSVTEGLRFDRWVHEVSSHLMHLPDENVKKMEAERGQ